MLIHIAFLNYTLIDKLAEEEGWASLVAQTVKNPPAMQETQVQSLGWEDPLEEEMATRSSTLAWEIPRTEEPGGLQPMGSQSQTQLIEFYFHFHLFGYAESWFQHAGSSFLKVKSESRSVVSDSL